MQRWLAHLPKWPTLALALLNGVGLWACLAQLWHDSAARALLSTAAQEIPRPTQSQDPARTRADFAIVQSAALFHGSRRFHAPPAVAEVQSRPDYRLSGTLILPNRPAVAMLIQNQTGARHKVRQGDELEGWTVESIRPRLVTLRHGQHQLEIR
jgi:type II secretory pathway component PulC